MGLEDGLGVECLSGSGAIASAYSRAFREGFTLTLVSGRTVGIGAYLARLGRRCVAGAPADGCLYCLLEIRSAEGVPAALPLCIGLPGMARWAIAAPPHPGCLCLRL